MNTKGRFITSFAFASILILGPIGFVYYSKASLSKDIQNHTQSTSSMIEQRMVNGRCEAISADINTSVKVTTTIIPNANREKSSVQIHVKESGSKIGYDSYSLNAIIRRDVDKIDMNDFNLKEITRTLLDELPATKSIVIDYCS